MGKFRKLQAMWWPVKVKLAKGGKKFDTENIEVKYQRLDADDLKELASRSATTSDMSDAEKAEVGQRVVEDVRDNMLDWKIEDENCEPLEFNDDNVDMVLAHPDYRNAIVNGFFEMQAGGAAKN